MTTIRAAYGVAIGSSDVERDRSFLEAVGAKCMTEIGFETPVH
jgi:hypothetical protein